MNIKLRIKFILGLTLLALTLTTSFPLYAKTSAYQQGQLFIDQQDWRKAEKQFRKVVKKKGDNADAAYYWLAYVQKKRGETHKAINSLAKLRKHYPQSTWLDDAQTLEWEIKGGKSDPNALADEELKLYALSSLMHSSSDRAIEILKNFLRGNHSEKLKKRALFVLSQNHQPEAFQMIINIASGEESYSKDPRINNELRAHALEILGISGSSQNAEILLEIYSKTDDSHLKNRVLHALFMSEKPDALFKLIKQEKNPELQKQGIILLGAMGSADMLTKLYKDKSFAKHSDSIIHALGMSGDDDTLVEIMKNTKDINELIKIIRQPAVFTNPESADYMYKAYQNTDEHELKRVIMRGFFAQQDASKLMKLYEDEDNPELKREVLKMLSMIPTDETLELFQNILDKGE